MLKTRILTSLLLIPSFLAALFYLPHLYWALLMLVVVSIGLWEWAQILKLKPMARALYILLPIILSLVLLFNGEQIIEFRKYIIFWVILAAAVFWIFLVPVLLLLARPLNNNFLMAMIGWLMLFSTWLALLSLRNIDHWLLLALMVAVWIADTAAYFCGKRFGKHKLAPSISPGKTWEGVWGAFLAISLYGLFLCVSLNRDYWLIVALLFLTVLSIMGDLLESLVKRQAGVKDSGSLLPGHGGVLDRIDGLMATLPVATFVYFLPYYQSALIHRG